MFGKKKIKEEEKEKPEPTERIDTPIGRQTAETKLDVAKYVVEEFQKTFFGIVGGKDLEQVNGEVLSINLLFAIYGELRLARLEREQK